MNKKSTTEEFIIKAKKVHGNKYDYSRVEYVKASQKIIIICPIHGKFLQTPNNHLYYGCHKCSSDNRVKNSFLTQEEFLQRSMDTHKNKYSYSKSIYTGVFNKIIITCPTHGNFFQAPSNHMKGAGCPKCRNDSLSKERSFSKEEFIDRAKQVHGHVYDYSGIIYKNMYKPILIKCLKHGYFECVPADHIFNNKVCSLCSKTISRGEKIILLFLTENNIYFESQYRFLDCRNKNPLPFDFAIFEDQEKTKLKCLIEFDGEQHFRPLIFMGGLDSYEKTIYNDSIKTKYCEDNKIILHRIPYNTNTKVLLRKIFNVI